MNIKQLTAEQMAEARERAKQMALPPMPKQEDYEEADGTPRWIAIASTIGLVALLVAPYVISVFKMVKVGYYTFLHSFVCYGAQALCQEGDAGSGERIMGIIVGLSLPLMAEAAVVVASLLYEKTEGKAMKWAAITLGISGTLVAIAGNLEMSRPWEATNYWYWMFALSPPLLVMLAGLMLKTMAADDSKKKIKKKERYERAMLEWEFTQANPEHSKKFMDVYPGVIRSALIEENKTLGRANLALLPEAFWVNQVKMHIQREKGFAGMVWADETQPIHAELAVPESF